MNLPEGYGWNNIQSPLFEEKDSSNMCFFDHYESECINCSNPYCEKNKDE